jgi:hypothetical protein
MAANGISTLTIPSGITATSFTQASSYLVAVGTFNYDAYGAGFAIRKDGGTLDAYMAQVIALGAGARNWTFVPGNGQPSFTRSMTQPDGTNTSNDPSESGVAIWNVTTAAGNLSGTGAGQINIALIPNGTSFVIYATELGGGGGADKEARQLAKLAIAEAKRQGKTVALDGTVTGSVDDTKPYYRAANTLDTTLLPTLYSGNTVVDNPNGLIGGVITNITIATPLTRSDGGNYLTPANVSIQFALPSTDGGYGSNRATGTPVITSGKLSGITIVSGGSGYAKRVDEGLLNGQVLCDIFVIDSTSGSPDTRELRDITTTGFDVTASDITSTGGLVVGRPWS